jgi:hypothetical protein
LDDASLAALAVAGVARRSRPAATKARLRAAIAAWLARPPGRGPQVAMSTKRE